MDAPDVSAGVNAQGPDKAVLIAIVSHDRRPDFETDRAVNMCVPGLMVMGWRVAQAVHVGDADLAGARNYVLSQFLHQVQLTRLLFVDADVSCDPGGIERLLSHNVDLVFGAYPRRFDDGGYAVSLPPEGVSLVDPATGRPRADGLLSVPGGPTGFMAISRRCAARMTEAYGDDWYADYRSPDMRTANLFQFAVVDHERYTEDTFFCKRWVDLGEKVWCDPHLMLHHHGTKTYSGRYIDYLPAGKA